MGIVRALAALAVAGGLSAASGCRSCGTDEPMSADLAAYLALCAEVAVGEKPDADWKDDWMVGAGVTTWERSSSYKVVYADADYLSFRAEEYAYNGGAHGGTKVTVGTLRRKDGTRARLADFVPAEKMPALAKALFDGVTRQIGGAENLQGEVKPIENFHVAKDGLHFVYNEYEVACYAAGRIDVVVKVEEL